MNPRREVVSEVLDGNLTPHRLHDADHLGQNRTRNPSKSSSNNLYTDDNFFSDTSSLHKHEDVSSDPSASSVGSGRSGDDSDGLKVPTAKSTIQTSQVLKIIAFGYLLKQQIREMRLIVLPETLLMTTTMMIMVME